MCRRDAGHVIFEEWIEQGYMLDVFVANLLRIDSVGMLLEYVLYTEQPARNEIVRALVVRRIATQQ
jgi:hypothetical protein